MRNKYWVTWPGTGANSWSTFVPSQCKASTLANKRPVLSHMTWYRSQQSEHTCPKPIGSKYTSQWETSIESHDLDQTVAAHLSPAWQDWVEMVSLQMQTYLNALLKTLSLMSLYKLTINSLSLQLRSLIYLVKDTKNAKTLVAKK